jgi:hypothetical protein
VNAPFRAHIASVRTDILEAAQAKAQRERLSNNQMTENALAEWCGFGKPIPIPVPFIITIIKEPDDQLP